jgi:hypothetical protein
MKLKDTPELRELIDCLSELHESAINRLLSGDGDAEFDRMKANAVYSAGEMLLARVDGKDGKQLAKRYAEMMAQQKRNTFFYKRGD